MTKKKGKPVNARLLHPPRPANRVAKGYENITIFTFKAEIREPQVKPVYKDFTFKSRYTDPKT